MPASRRFEVRGHKISSRSRRRFVVVAVREHGVFVADSASGIRLSADRDATACRARAEQEAASRRIDEEIVMRCYVRFAYIEMWSNNLATAQAAARRIRNEGALAVDAVVVDTTTGEEI